MLISHIMIRYLVHEMEADEGTDSSHELSRYKRKRLDYQKAEKYLLLHEASLENAIERREVILQINQQQLNKMLPACRWIIIKVSTYK